MNVYRQNIRALRGASAAVLACLLAPLAVAPALSADLGVAPIYRAPPASVSTWTGSYLGISGGGAWGNAVVHNDPTGFDQTPRFDLSGGIIGITSGLNIQNGAIVYGYESDTSITSKKGSAFEFPPPVGFLGISNEVREPWLSTYRGRLGYTQNNWLLYATAGGALAEVQNKLYGPPGTIVESHWHWGWTVGGGVEFKFAKDWSAKVEYLYVGLQDKSYFNPAPSPAFPSGQRVSLDDHLVRFGVNYKLPWSILDVFFKR